MTGYKPVDYDPFAGGGLSSSHPTTEAQKEMWLAAQLGREANCSYNLTVRLDFSVRLDATRFEQAMIRTAERHASLRTTFSRDGEFFNVTDDTIADFFVREGDDDLLDELIDAEAETPFDLSAGPLWRCQFVNRPSGTTVLITTHHLAADGWSTGIVISDLASFYSLDSAPAEPAAEFAQYLAWIDSTDRQAQIREDLAYWETRFQDHIESPTLPSLAVRRPLKDFRCGFLQSEFPEALLRKAEQYARQNRLTISTLLTAVFAIYLSNLSGKRDVVIGVPSAGQIDSGLTGLVGHCVNTIPFRTTIDDGKPFSALIEDIKADFLDALDHRKVTFGTLLKQFPRIREQCTTPLVPVVFNVEAGDFAVEFADSPAAVEFLPRRFEVFDFSVNCAAVGDGMEVHCHYNDVLYDESYARSRLPEFQQLLAGLIDDDSRSVTDVVFLLDEQRRSIERFNDTAVDFGAFTDLVSTIDDYAETSPDALALIHRDRQVTYSELRELSTAIAGNLQAAGIGKGDVVAVMLPRNADLVVAMLGVMKAGAAYLPVDTELPPKRASFLVEDAAARAVISTRDWTHLLSDAAVNVSDFDELVEAPPATTASPRLDPDDLAYVIYTSGSTGRPKGVRVAHSSLSNLLKGSVHRIGFSSTDRFVNLTTLAFDGSVFESWVPLFVGARTTIVDRRESQDGRALARIIDDQEITVVHATPSSWELLLASDWQGSGRLIALSGGEALTIDLSSRLLPLVKSLWNVYGPTEATVSTALEKVRSTDRPVSIGTPIPNARLYVVGETGAWLPPGVGGELCIAGDCLSRGYLGRPELTSEKFRFHDGIGEYVYHSGDLGYYDQETESAYYLGRIDDQVKHRGYRIELGEISSTFAEHFDIDEALAMVVASHGQEIIALAYSRDPSGRGIDEAEGRRLGREYLPEYMVPSVYVGVDEFPQTSSRKIDKRGVRALVERELRQRADEAENRGDVEQLTEFEELIVNIFKSALGGVSVSTADNFFDIGGHSLVAMKTVMQLGEIFDTNVDLSLIFDYPVIGDFASRFEETLQSEIAASADGQSRTGNV